MNGLRNSPGKALRGGAENNLRIAERNKLPSLKANLPLSLPRNSRMILFLPCVPGMVVSAPEAPQEAPQEPIPFPLEKLVQFPGVQPDPFTGLAAIDAKIPVVDLAEFRATLRAVHPVVLALSLSYGVLELLLRLELGLLSFDFQRPPPLHLLSKNEFLLSAPGAVRKGCAKGVPRWKWNGKSLGFANCVHGNSR